MKLPLALLAALCLLTSVSAADPAPSSPPAKYRAGDWEDDIGYRSAVRVGDTVYLSGVAAAGAMPDAIRSVYGELREVLARYGLTFAHVVKENLYTTDLEAVKANLAVRRAFYAGEYPAATWVQVSRLYEAGHVIEVELIAVVPASAGERKN